MSKDNNDSFPFLEEDNFLGWLVIFRAHLRKQNRAHEVLDKPVPKPPADANGNPIPMNQAQRTAFQNELKDYMEKDDIAFSDLMKACIRSPKAKVIAETGGFENAYPLLERLRSRFCKNDEISKATHLANYHSLRMNKTENGSEFLDKLAIAEVALKSAGEELSDTAKLSKLIASTQGNKAYADLARSIYSTPGMTFAAASSLFEGYERSGLLQKPEDEVVNAIFCRYCKRKGHSVSTCKKKKNRDGDKGGSTHRVSNSERQSRSGRPSRGGSHKSRFPCAICDQKGHPSYQCPLKSSLREFLAQNGKVKRQKVTSWNPDVEEPPPDDNDSCNMVSDLVFGISNSQSAIVDSGSTVTIVRPDVCDEFSEITSTSRSIGTADKGGSLSICAEGSIGLLSFWGCV
jgi:hypothetical protein